jgi:aminoglycoside/choline kinase family phosphotransferase
MEYSNMPRRASFPKIRAEDLIREKTRLRGPFHWEPLHGDGSQRTFYRVSDGKGSLVVAWSPPEDQRIPNENDSYVYLSEHLRSKGIPVPEIYGYSRPEGLTLLEDLGSVHLQEAVESAEESLLGLYHQALELLLKMQAKGTKDLDPSHCFDTAVYDPPFIIRRELEYFRWSFLEGALGLEIDSAYLKDDFSLLATRAGQVGGQAFFVHRDFQSRNLMVKGDLLYLIDFQGARLGPPQYDLASLLIDPYVQLPEHIQIDLLEVHSRNLSELTGISVEEFVYKFSHVALCRNLQILAAFSFLTSRRGRPHFARYIIPAWRGLRRLLTAGTLSDYRSLANLVNNQSEEMLARVAARLEMEARSAERQGPGA